MSQYKLNEPVGHAPFFMVMLYIVGSIILYWLGPIQWPMTNPIELASFQLLIIISVCAGYFSINSHFTCQISSIDLKPFFKIGVLSTLVLQVPLTLTYTAKYPWEIFQTIFDQRAAYEEMLVQVLDQNNTRFYVPLFRSLIMPLNYAALAYGILNFSKLHNVDKFLLVLCILCPINLSLLRGTDKEIFDLFIIIGGLVLIRQRRIILNNFNIKKNSFKKRSVLLIITLVLSATIFSVFTYRKYQRMGSTAEFCVADNLVCAEYDGILMSMLPDFLNFGFAMLTGYLTNGYYGLSLALNQPFEFAYGLGHSSALQQLFQKIFDITVLDLTLIGKASASGWDHRYYWFTIFPWIASDVGFLGSLIFIGFVARWFKESWRDSIYCNNDCAAVVFVLLCILFFYLPANNQLTQTLDSYFTFLSAFVAWKIFKVSKKIT
jgi:hypothetical protein